MTVTFAVRDIGRLVRNPDAGLLCEQPRRGKPYSYYPRNWLYQAAAALFESGGDSGASRARLESLVAAGKGPTPKKLRTAADIESLLPKLTFLSQQHPARYVSTLYKHVPDLVIWKGHRLKLPLGLLFEDDKHGFVMRVLWVEKYLRPGVRGIDLTAGALAVSIPAEVGLACAVEPWFLRDSDRRFYLAKDLRLMRQQLDRLLIDAERRREVSPAA
ncbi:MAG TPA: hypothetical protein VJ850_07240 [Candidatus Limnocylindrales bacterium]|nr:hypothetical protein [Candidatus Limnocylindrales bacterium]